MAVYSDTEGLGEYYRILGFLRGEEAADISTHIFLGMCVRFWINPISKNDHTVGASVIIRTSGPIHAYSGYMLNSTIVGVAA